MALKSFAKGDSCMVLDVTVVRVVAEGKAIVADSPKFHVLERNRICRKVVACSRRLSAVVVEYHRSRASTVPLACAILYIATC